jgi:hypothetical protein
MDRVSRYKSAGGAMPVFFRRGIGKNAPPTIKNYHKDA